MISDILEIGLLRKCHIYILLVDLVVCGFTWWKLGIRVLSQIHHLLVLSRCIQMQINISCVEVWKSWLLSTSLSHLNVWYLKINILVCTWCLVVLLKVWTLIYSVWNGLFLIFNHHFLCGLLSIFCVLIHLGVVKCGRLECVHDWIRNCLRSSIQLGHIKLDLCGWHNAFNLKFLLVYFLCLWVKTTRNSTVSPHYFFCLCLKFIELLELFRCLLLHHLVVFRKVFWTPSCGSFDPFLDIFLYNFAILLCVVKIH